MSGITLDSLDTIQIVDSGGDSLEINGDGSINATVSATDLDIRGLNVATDGDHVYLTDSTGANALAVAADGSIAVTDNGTTLSIDDGGGSITVDGTVNVAGGEADDAAAVTNPLGIGGVTADPATALAEISAAGDRAHLLQDMYRRVFVRDSNDVAWQVTPFTIGATETEVASTPLNGRKEVIIQNTASNSVWVGEATGVTTTGATRGIEIPKKSSMKFNFGEALDLFVISDGAGREINVLEAA